MLARLLLLEELLAADAGAERDAVHRRDREIGRAFDAGPRGDAHRALAWVEQRATPESLDEIESGLRAARLVLALLGLLFGAVLAAGALYFDGGSRVNVLAVLALLCGLPAATSLLSALLMLPRRWRQRIPLLASVQDAASTFSPGRAIISIARRLSPRHRERLLRWRGEATARSRVYGEVGRWIALHASQVFALAFAIGVFGAFLARVTFSDLAFGWSTTLQTEPAALHALTRTLAAPWSPWFPGAVPSTELVESTRYFRLDPAPPPGGAERLGGWWPFLAMCMGIYTLAPRLMLFAIGRVALIRSIRSTVTLVAGVPELLYRLDNDLVETRAHGAEVGAEAAGSADESGAGALAPNDCAAIVWADVEADEAILAEGVERACGLRAHAFLRAGGAASLDADRETLAQIDADVPAVAVLVKSWEPPLAELVDFLEDLRATLGPGRPVAIVALAESPGQAPAPDALATWRRRMAAVGDPWLSVHAIEGALT